MGKLRSISHLQKHPSQIRSLTTGVCQRPTVAFIPWVCKDAHTWKGLVEICCLVQISQWTGQGGTSSAGDFLYSHKCAPCSDPSWRVNSHQVSSSLVEVNSGGKEPVSRAYPETSHSVKGCFLGAAQGFHCCSLYWCLWVSRCVSPSRVPPWCLWDRFVQEEVLLDHPSPPRLQLSKPSSSSLPLYTLPPTHHCWGPGSLHHTPSLNSTHFPFPSSNYSDTVSC